MHEPMTQQAYEAWQTALPDTLPDLRGKTAVITGAGRGIGRCLAVSFAAGGARVFLADRDETGGLECEAIIRRRGGQAVFMRTDVSSDTDVAALMASAAQDGGIDYLVNNAAIADAGSAHLFSDDLSGFDRVLAVNLRGPFVCAKMAVPYMKGRPAAIVNIASTRALMSEPRSEAYAASKGGLVALTHALAVSLENSGIRVNCISPGWIDTSGWRREGEPVSRHSEADSSQHPAGRVGRPADIASACLWLCSSDAGFVTGTNLVIDGGMTRRMIYV